MKRAVVPFLIVCLAASAARADPPKPPEAPRTLTLLTYNVLGKEYETDTRIPALLKIVGDADADVVVFQEVAPWFLERLLKQDWVKRYHLPRHGGKIVHPAGLLILSKFPVKRFVARPFPSRQGRLVMVAHIDFDGRTLAVATTHMESPLESGRIRAQQLDVIFPLLKDADDAILLGDFNFGDGEEPETSRLPADFVDLWRTLKPKDPGYTWNIEKSDLAKRQSFPNEKSRRIDRILVRSKVWQPKSIRIIGDEPVIPGNRLIFPSDHFGLLATVERRH